MIQNIFLPKLGETMSEATIETWHKAEGDAVKKGEVILEITTDKATLEVESLASGVMRKILAPKGAVLPVNTVIALVGEASDALPANVEELAAIARGEKGAVKSAAAKPEAEAATVAATAPAESAPLVATPAGEIRVSPRARKAAAEARVPLTILKGSGENGRITEKDVLAYLAKRDALKATPVAIAVAYGKGIDITRVKPSPDGRVTKEDVLAAPAAPAGAPQAGRIELTAMRRVVADRMTKSKREAPHFYLMMDIDMTAAAALRKQINNAGGARIAFHDMIIRACAKALIENPQMNVQWAGDHIRRRGEVNISLAVALDEGLIVPVVKNADRLNLVQTSEASKKLIDKARSKRLTPDEYEGGCLTLSNLGMYDIENFMAVINPGEVAILGVGRIAEKVVVREGGIHIRSMMGCTLSADHRAVDGAIAAAFLKRVKDLLEQPELLQD